MTDAEGAPWEIVGWERSNLMIRAHRPGEPAEIRQFPPGDLGISWRVPPSPQGGSISTRSMLSAAGFLLGLLTWIFVFGGMLLRSCSGGG